MTYSLEDKKNIIYLRNQLINADIEDLTKIYSSKEDYGFFIDTLHIALATEPIFFILNDEIFQKAETLLQNKRFDYINSTFSAVINEIIGYMNHLQNIPEDIKRLQRRQYMLWHREQRETSFTSEEDFFRALAYDAILIEKLYGGGLDQTDVDVVYFFSSTNYLAKMLPEFYQEEPTRIEKTLHRLEHHAAKRGLINWPERSFARGAIRNIQKVKIKEE